MEIFSRMATSLLPAALLCLRPGQVLYLNIGKFSTSWSNQNSSLIGRPARSPTPASSGCLPSPSSSSHLWTIQSPTTSPRYPPMGGQQTKTVSAVGDVKEKKEPRMHQAMPQSRRSPPCTMPFPMLSLHNLEPI